ncbi:Gfo/Idh/MocA family oxidoreductase [Streptomyces sp. HNM0574]|uniref:Gfo/Idh/MocA family protein n=1 Tax=Streptomyces sp. HNM0574 TaxID=2714954 RepID=UPI0032169463
MRIGVLGAASIARRRVLPAMARRPELTLVATASRSLPKAREIAEEFGGEAVEGYERLLARDDIEAVYIPLPVTMHAEWTERALRAGLHVLCEKPLTGELGSTRRLTALARERGLTLMENLMYRWHSQHRTVRELLDSGAVGEVRTLTAEFAFPPKSPKDMRYQPVGGGALIEIGVYPISTALLYLGDRLDVLGASVRRHARTGVDLSGAALLSAPDGRYAHLTWGMEHAYRSVYEIWGSEGRLVVEWAYTPPATHSPVVRIEQQGRVERLTLPPDDQFGNVLADFGRAVRGADEGTHAEDSLRLAALMDDVATRVLMDDVATRVRSAASAPPRRTEGRRTTGSLPGVRPVRAGTPTLEGEKHG